MRSRNIWVLALVLASPSLGLQVPLLSTPSAPSFISPQLSASLSQERYDGHKVWRLDWSGLSEQVKRDLTDAIELLNLDVWRSTPSSLDIHLAPSELFQLIPFIPSQTPFQPFIHDLQHHIDASSPPVHTAGLYVGWDTSTLDTPFHDSYHSLEELDAFGDALISTFSDKGVIFDKFSVGTTAEGRDIRGWKVRMEKDDLHRGRGKKRVRVRAPEEGVREFVVQAGQHAREWVGPAAAMYFLHELVLEATANPHGDIAQLLKAFTFTVVPTINPDGYVYSREKSRMWRKNRQEVEGATKGCLGIDLNSNWGYKWRPSRLPVCSDSFPGHREFEALETEAMGKYLTNGTAPIEDLRVLGGDREPTPAPAPGERRVRAFVDLHSYGQLFMFPFAHSCDDFPPDAEMLTEAGLGVAKAMRSKSGQNYQAGQACDLTYRAPGDAIDFSYGIADARWSYSAELRDTGTYGFMLPPHLIRPTADEVSAGLMYLARFIYNAEVSR